MKKSSNIEKRLRDINKILKIGDFETTEVLNKIKHTRDALILTRLSGLNVEESVSVLKTVMNFFNKKRLDTTEVLNKLANVDAKFAVSSRDLAQALSRVGSSASDAGISFDQLLAVITSVRKTTGQSSTIIGNALKTIFTRIERPETLKTLQKWGVVTKCSRGKKSSVLNIFRELADRYDTLNASEKARIDSLMGGVFQANVFKALISDPVLKLALRAHQATHQATLKNQTLNAISSQKPTH